MLRSMLTALFLLAAPAVGLAQGTNAASADCCCCPSCPDCPCCPGAK